MFIWRMICGFWEGILEYYREADAEEKRRVAAMTPEEQEAYWDRMQYMNSNMYDSGH